MLVKISGKKLDFEPGSIDWRHQSSPHTRFGVWSTAQGLVFVKRFSEKPSGWGLLKKVQGKKLNNAPEVLALMEGEDDYFAFFEWLDGDILNQILQKDQIADFFGPKRLDDRARNLLTISVYGTLAHLHRLGFWYPDLDFKNIFISSSGDNIRIFLIDMDSCVRFGEVSNPDQVSQRYWEGLISTYREAGKPFIKKGLQNSERDISAHGRSLNQSMLLLFAYAVKRLGKVPPDAPLYPLLISQKNPMAQEVMRLHAGWKDDRNLEKDLHCWLADYLKMTSNELSKTTSKLTPASPTGWGSLISRLFGN